MAMLYSRAIQVPSPENPRGPAIAISSGMGAALSWLLILSLSPPERFPVPNFPVAWGKEATCEAVEYGLASFYGVGDGFAGKKTANGEIYEIDKFTAAHMSLPIGSIVRVRYQENKVFVRINDRGPASWTGNSIDLTPKAFEKLAPLERGVVPVTIELFHKIKVKERT
jgi:rare lipoprotein A